MFFTHIILNYKAYHYNLVVLFFYYSISIVAAIAKFTTSTEDKYDLCYFIFNS